MFSTRQYCGHCEKLGDLTFVFVAQQYWEKPEPRGASHRMLNVRVSREGDTSPGYAVAACPLCGGPNLVMFDAERYVFDGLKECVSGKAEGMMGGESVIAVSSVFPKRKSVTEHPSWPEKLRRLYVDAQHGLREGKSPEIAVATLRSVLDVATKEAGGTQEKLVQRINELRDAGKLTQSMAKWAHALRLEGNTAVHEIDANAVQAAELASFVGMLLDMLFTLPATINARQVSTP
jgi:hypothetical protein